MSGVMIAAPASGSGKTTVTLGLLRALRRRGVALAPGKAGPDYIDPAFHAAASGETCLNYDPWAMRPELLTANAMLARQGGRMLVVEAMMGLFDAAADGRGSAADLAAMLNLPVILVVDCAKMSHSVAALVEGFRRFRDDIMVGGVILNRVASERHERMLRDALVQSGARVLGAVRRQDDLVLPERHLGLVQAGEHEALEAYIEQAADLIDASVDVTAIGKLAALLAPPVSDANIPRLRPLGQRIAVARDVAFAFVYEHLLLSWRRRGAEIAFFSPLADEAPAADSDAIYLPGGYPELHAGTLAGAARFRQGMSDAIGRGATIYGECGGYMVLGEGLIDAQGHRHAMLGALPLVTSFGQRRRRLGYRRLTPRAGFVWQEALTAHEFHYSSVVSEGAGERLFDVGDAVGTSLDAAGLRRGPVAGSFMHVIDLAGDALR